MSYDVSLQIDAGAKELVTIPNTGRNYTYNCSPMFRLALGGDGINDLDGKIAGDLIDRLDKAVSDIRNPANRRKYQRLNPENGWGNHDGAAQFLQAILDDCRAYPKASVRVS